MTFEVLMHLFQDLSSQTHFIAFHFNNTKVQ